MDINGFNLLKGWRKNIDLKLPQFSGQYKLVQMYAFIPFNLTPQNIGVRKIITFLNSAALASLSTTLGRQEVAVYHRLWVGIFHSKILTVSTGQQNNSLENHYK